MRQRPRIFYGWYIVAAFMVIQVFVGGALYYTFTAFFLPVQREYGWSATAIAGTFSIQKLEAGVAGPFVGFLVDRFGPRRPAFFGMCCIIGGMFALAHTSNLWTFYLYFLIVSLGVSFCSAPMGYTTVAQWFHRNRGKAFGLVTAGAGFSGVAAPVLIFLISHYGWRAAFAVSASFYLLFMLPLTLLFRHKPEHHGLLPDGDTPETLAVQSEASKPDVKPKKRRQAVAPTEDFVFKEAMRTRAFWMLTLAYSTTQMALAGFSVHMVPYLTQRGLPEATAGIAITALTSVSLVGRLGFGWQADVRDVRLLMAGTFALQAIGGLFFVFLFQAWMLAPFLALYSVGSGGSIAMRPNVLAAYFGRKNFGSIQGMQFGLISVGTFAGPVLAGLSVDITGTYVWAFLAYTILLGLAVPTMLASRAPRPAAREA